MADKHPYMSGTGPFTQVITHLRKSFPQTVNADTLKKLGYAPNNESYVINILRFVGIIGEDGGKTDTAATTFSQHNDADFQQHFSKQIERSYSDLFSLHGEDAWELDTDKLISFFRANDGSSDLVGRRQASTFRGLAVLAGKGTAPPSRANGRKSAPGDSPKRKTATKASVARRSIQAAVTPPPVEDKHQNGRDLGLTVRIEINLPANGDQETYDRIFRSIRENLIGNG